MLQQAVGLHQLGRIGDARVLYERILEREPHHFDALHLLGVIAVNSGDASRAPGLIERALEISRVAASILHAIRLPELITGSANEFEDLAVRLAGDPALLASLKTRLAARRADSPLFDIERDSRGIERLYGEMARRHRAGLPPDHLGTA